ncbi:LysM peptidoglycan-binding domain-containing protein [Aliiroseovarius sp.]|uniref:LysM peptidoglycan-binding domain-containing protein n=1 Tax=Aliiroseovarius sp. TaxID=1872442 RepID=UPI003BA980C4
MHRIAILVASFLVAIVGLIFLQGGRDDAPRVAAVEPADLTDVTDLSAPMPGATPVSPAPASASVPAPVAEAPVLPAEGGEMAAMTASVLAGLGVKTAAPVDAAPSAEGDMRAMTSSVLAGLGVATGGAPAQEELSLEEIIARAVAAGDGDDYLDMLLNEASDQGLIEVPDALRTVEGGVDTTTLINTIVAATSEEAPQERPTVGGQGVEVRMIMEAGRTVQVNFYTVQDGDSLGAIAHRFYGDASLFTEIYEANRRLLPSPELIRKGQRLSIPNLDA